jgi:DNA polymerase (family 10)
MTLAQEIAERFRTMAAILEIRGEPVFKSIAFTRVARLLDDASIDLADLVSRDALDSLEGVGKSSRSIIVDLVRNGRSDDYDSLASSIPPGLIDMLNLPGVGPKTIALFWRERGIESIQQLESALSEGKLAGLKGIGPKKLEQLADSIRMRAVAQTRAGIGHVIPIASTLLEAVRGFSEVEQADVAGSLRRRRETIGDLDLLAALRPGSEGAVVTDRFTHLMGVREILACGPTKASIRTESNLQVDLRVVPAACYGAAMQYFTGSKEHNVKLRSRAQDRGLTLNEWGLWKADDWDTRRDAVKASAGLGIDFSSAVASRREADIYAKLDLAFIEPELREDRGEIEQAAQHKLPKLIERQDLRGELHCHTTASDGEASILDMAHAARALGLDYIVITDHSRSQVIARGLEPERLLQQILEVRKLDGKIPGITILIGSEVDILADGSLDYDDDILRQLDFVVASPHTALRQDSGKATERLLRAIDNPYVNVIGHPTGRLINQRAGLEPEWAKIFEAAHASGTALEINASYPRLDLNDDLARAAIRAGCTLTIDTDAHSTAGLGEVDLGIAVARRAGAEAKNVLNCGTLADIKAWVKRKRDR